MALQCTVRNDRATGVHPAGHVVLREEDVVQVRVPADLRVEVHDLPAERDVLQRHVGLVAGVALGLTSLGAVLLHELRLFLGEHPAIFPDALVQRGLEIRNELEHPATLALAGGLADVSVESSARHRQGCRRGLEDDGGLRAVDECRQQGVPGTRSIRPEGHLACVEVVDGTTDTDHPLLSRQGTNLGTGLERQLVGLAAYALPRRHADFVRQVVMELQNRAKQVLASLTGVRDDGRVGTRLVRRAAVRGVRRQHRLPDLTRGDDRQPLLLARLSARGVPHEVHQAPLQVPTDAVRVVVNPVTRLLVKDLPERRQRVAGVLEHLQEVRREALFPWDVLVLLLAHLIFPSAGGAWVIAVTRPKSPMHAKRPTQRA